ncbi:MAG: glycosyltransferase, partial [Chloroflexi bacterium]|nr:glycosyltransferase [Chloroflexota bacterium]
MLAFVPHFNGHRWLEQCLESLARQSRPPDAIVVVDDHSASSPAQIVGRFDGVTFLRASTNVGPYRLLQQIVRDTDCDAYLLQDADDWSACDRLSLLLGAAEASGAEVVGCQELRVMDDDARLLPVS